MYFVLDAIYQLVFRSESPKSSECLITRSMEGFRELKDWIRSFSKAEGRKPQAADMPDKIREAQSSSTKNTQQACLKLFVQD